MRYIMWSAAVVFGLPGFLSAQQAPQMGAELLADATAARPGKPLTVGVLLRIPPGWHIYWTNPGDAGAPTKVRIRWPAGLTGGEVQFPVPERFEQPGGIVGYGYEGTVLLPATAEISPQVKPGTTVEFVAQVSWLCCKDVCVPGKATVHLRLPVAEASGPAHADLFGPWGRRVPISYEIAGSPAAKVQVTGSLSQATQSQFTIDVDWKMSVREVEWFPEAGPAIEISEIHAKTNSRHSRIMFVARVLPGQRVDREPPLRSIVAYTDAMGDRRGISVPVHLLASDLPREDTTVPSGP